MKYIGSNAGSNLACPTIKTTNDMPIIQPHDFNGLNLINFQINPHYPAKKLLEHMGESRRTRLLEFQEENDFDVIGVPESGFIEVDGPNIQFRGKEAAFWFKNGSVKPVYPNTHWTNL